MKILNEKGKKYNKFKTKIENFLKNGKDAEDKIYILITTNYQYIKRSYKL